MKFFKWLFNVGNRHYGDIRRYEKGKIGTRIFVILLLLGLVAGTLGLEYWGVNLFKTNIFYGFLVLLFLFIPFAGATIEFCGVYSYIGFRMFVRGTVIDIAKKLDKKIEQKQFNQIEVDENIVVDTNTELNDETKVDKLEKAHKWIDLFIGILGIVLGVGVVILALVMFVYLNK